MSGKNEQQQTDGAVGASKLMPMTIEALAIQVGVAPQGLEAQDGETETDFVTRVLPMLGERMTAAIAVIAEENAALKRQLRSQKGAATKARGRIEEMQEASRPRRFGPVKTALDATDLITAIDAASEVVLAFSDGRSELTGIAPRKLPGGTLVLRRGRVMMLPDAEMLVVAPGGDAPPQSLAGIALLLDGEQAAWCALAQPLALHGGVTINLATTVVF